MRAPRLPRLQALELLEEWFPLPHLPTRPHSFDLGSMRYALFLCGAFAAAKLALFVWCVFPALTGAYPWGARATRLWDGDMAPPPDPNPPGRPGSRVAALYNARRPQAMLLGALPQMDFEVGVRDGGARPPAARGRGGPVPGRRDPRLDA